VAIGSVFAAGGADPAAEVQVKTVDSAAPAAESAI
jgi:hypothetical protein